MNIFYRLADKLYVNVTNKCSCDCVFCIRKNGDSVGDADTLWLEHEPSIEEIKSSFLDLKENSDKRKKLDGVIEIVFCGYGEPLERAEEVVEIAKFLKSETNLPLRLNTNGLVELINPEFDISTLDIFDTVSVSLNADNATDYNKITRPTFGEGAFDALLKFASEIKPYTNVFFTIVDTPKSLSQKPIDVEKCKKISSDRGIPLRVRVYEGEENK